MADRQPLSKKVRFDVFKRDGFKCCYCGANPSDTVVLEVDHVVPVAEGGQNDIDNLVTSCQPCNRGKGAIPLDVIPQTLEEKASIVAEREAQIRAYREIMELRSERLEEETWSVAEIFMDRFRRDTINKDELLSIRMFIQRLDVYEVQEAMEIAVMKKTWPPHAFKYFCGVCWTKIRDRGSS